MEFRGFRVSSFGGKLVKIVIVRSPGMPRPHVPAWLRTSS